MSSHNHSSTDIKKLLSNAWWALKLIWSTNTPFKEVNSVELYYTLNGGTKWILIDTLPGNAESKLWKVPNVRSAKRKCRVKVLLIASDGTRVGSDINDYDFTIAPPTSSAGIAVGNEMGDASTTSQP